MDGCASYYPRQQPLPGLLWRSNAHIVSPWYMDQARSCAYHASHNIGYIIPLAFIFLCYIYSKMHMSYPTWYTRNNCIFDRIATAIRHMVLDGSACVSWRHNILIGSMRQMPRALLTHQLPSSPVCKYLHPAQYPVSPINIPPLHNTYLYSPEFQGSIFPFIVPHLWLGGGGLEKPIKKILIVKSSFEE